MKLKIFLSLIIFAGVFALGGCGVVSSAVEGVTGIVAKDKTGTVIVARAQIRSSYAVVASDQLEVKRGQTLDVLDETDYEKVHWYHVRAHDEDNTEGWIEAQYIITGDLLDKSRKLADEDKDVLPQASAELRAASNLRLTPEQRDDNILFKLENGANFDVVDWKFVPKAADDSDVDDAPKSGEKMNKRQGKSKNDEIEAAKQENKPAALEEVYDIWYKVRLDPSVSPAPAGWLFGRQVSLQTPSDIVYYQINQKRFVTWRRLDDADSNSSNKDQMKMAKPGSWVILARSNFVKSKDGNEPDFDEILVLAYDKYNEEHYTIFDSGDVWGELPLRIDGTGDNKSFVVRVRNAAGQFEEKRFVLYRDKERLKVTPPPDIPRKR